MDAVRLNDSEWKVMKYIWDNEPVNAKTVAENMESSVGWKASSTYVVLSHLLEKGVIDRKYPKYTINSLISRSEIQKNEIRYMVDRMFDGSRKLLFSAFLEDEELSNEEISELNKMIEEIEKQ